MTFTQQSPPRRTASSTSNDSKTSPDKNMSPLQITLVAVLESRVWCSNFKVELLRLNDVCWNIFDLLLSFKKSWSFNLFQTTGHKRRWHLAFNNRTVNHCHSRLRWQTTATFKLPTRSKRPPQNTTGWSPLSASLSPARRSRSLFSLPLVRGCVLY